MVKDDVNRAHDDVTALLHAWGGGEPGAREQLMRVGYEELRRRAAARLRRERPGHVPQPTALVHEAYLRLVGQRRTDWQNRAHFFGVASEMMRRILVDHARGRKTAKRSGGWARVTIDEATAQYDPPDVNILDLDAALSELASFDPRKSRIAELRFFGGLSPEETAGALDISRATVDREWQAARALLYRRMSHTADGDVT